MTKDYVIQKMFPYFKSRGFENIGWQFSKDDKVLSLEFDSYNILSNAIFTSLKEAKQEQYYRPAPSFLFLTIKEFFGDVLLYVDKEETFEKFYDEQNGM
jgi:hypothetical protein